MSQGSTDKRPEGSLTRHRRSLDALTGLRFFAATWVVFFHTRSATSLKQMGFWKLGNFIGNGQLAVTLFFILSGFILAYNYRDQITKPGSWTRFWEARFARIYAIYALSLALVSLTLHYIPPTGLAVASIFMVQGWNPFHPEYAGIWNLVCWTLSMEAFFYLFFPPLQRWFEKLSLKAAVCLLALVLLLGILLNVSYAHPSTEQFVPWLPLPIARSFEFVIGVLLGNIFLLLRLHVAHHKQRFAGIGTYVALISAITLATLPFTRWKSLFLVPASLLIFSLAAENSPISRFLSSRWVVFGGAISYAMYLLQIPVKLWTRPLLRFVHIHSEFMGFAFMPFLLIAVSIPAYLFIEEPVRKALRRAFAKLSGPAY